MQLEDVPVVQLAGMASPYNPRRMDAAKLAKLRRSLRGFGVVQPVIVNRRTGRIVGGHQRVRAAEAERMETLPVHWVDLDATAEKQLCLALNKIVGDWDDDLLDALLADLMQQGVDLTDTGFDSEEIARVLAGHFNQEKEVTPSQVDGYREQYAVMIVCESESHQQEVYETLSHDGYNCRVVVT